MTPQHGRRGDRTGSGSRPGSAVAAVEGYEQVRQHPGGRVRGRLDVVQGVLQLRETGASVSMSLPSSSAVQCVLCSQCRAASPIPPDSEERASCTTQQGQHWPGSEQRKQQLLCASMLPSWAQSQCKRWGNEGGATDSSDAAGHRSLPDQRASDRSPPQQTHPAD